MGGFWEMDCAGARQNVASRGLGLGHDKACLEHLPEIISGSCVFVLVRIGVLWLKMIIARRLYRTERGERERRGIAGGDGGCTEQAQLCEVRGDSRAIEGLQP